VLVDTASTDDTAGLSRRIWDSFGTGIELRVVYEPLAGQVNARKKGIAVSRYSVVLFCDDDNWLSPGYVQQAFDILTGDPGVAACGGRGIPIFETEKPEWFDEYAEAFATGPQDLNSENGRIISLYGAGLAIKKQVLDELLRSGFDMLTGGRTGKSLGSADDIELTYALVLKGYRLVYAADMIFYHYLPGGRLTKEYLARLFSAFGKDGPIRNLYYAYITERPWHRKIGNWYFHVLLSLFRTGKYLVVPPKGSARMLYFRWNMAYLGQLMVMKADYNRMLQHISLLKRPVSREGASETVNHNFVNHHIESHDYEKVLY
jgi:glycosyltransferase involved in cell wall biosynthesis